MSHEAPAGHDVGRRAPIGAGGWIALASALAAGLVYTLVLLFVVVQATTTVLARVEERAAAPAPSASAPAEDDPDHAGDPFLTYPGYEDGDSALLLDQPSAEEAVATAEAALAAAEEALAGDWIPTDDLYYESAVNSYGGPSLLHDYVSVVGTQQGDPLDEAARRAVVERFAAALAPLGFDRVDVHDSVDEWYSAGFEVEADLADADASEALWVVRAWSSADYVPTVELGLVDLSADATGAVAAMLEDAAVTPPDSGFFLSAYASGLLEEDDRDEFVEAMRPFGGVDAATAGSETALAAG